jgi:hypothetical protein
MVLRCVNNPMRRSDYLQPHTIGMPVPQLSAMASPAPVAAMIRPAGAGEKKGSEPKNDWKAPRAEPPGTQATNGGYWYQEGEAILTIRATEGTPAPFRMNSM